MSTPTRPPCNDERGHRWGDKRRVWDGLGSCLRCGASNPKIGARMPESLLMRNVTFMIGADVDRHGDDATMWYLVCTQGAVAKSLLTIESGTTMEDIERVIREHITESHPEFLGH